jgi:hypothetical protein
MATTAAALATQHSQHSEVLARITASLAAEQAAITVLKVRCAGNGVLQTLF